MIEILFFSSLELSERIHNAINYSINEVKILVMPKNGGGDDHAKIFCGFDSLPDDNKTYENTAKKVWYPPSDQSESAYLRTNFCHLPSVTKKGLVL